MNFSFTKQQKMLKKSVNHFLSRECPEIAKEAESTDEGFFRDSWKKIAGLGWLGVGIPDEFGGIGGDILDLVIVLEEMGYFLFPGPYIQTIACSGIVMSEFGTNKQKETYLPGISAGDIIFAPALEKPQTMQDEIGPDENIRRDATSFQLTGTRFLIPYGKSADYFLYSGEDSDHKAVLFVVDAKVKGVDITSLDTIGSDRQCEVSLKDVHLTKDDIFGNRDHAGRIIQKIRQMGALSESAYLSGMLKRILDMTVEYAKQREQFGRPIGGFQIIQHQLADMFIMIEQVQNLTYHAAWKISAGESSEKEISMAKARASDAARFVSLMGVKIHGGIGIIDEYDMQHYFRRAKAREFSFGDADAHREMVADALGL